MGDDGNDLGPRCGALRVRERGAGRCSRTGLVGRDDAEDVVSAAMVNVFRGRTWSAVENRRAYLYRAVFNEAQALVPSRTRARSS